MKRLAIAAVGLALVVAMGGSTRGAAQSPLPPAIVSQACSVAYPGSIAVTFSWPETPSALQTWLDLSLFDSGFASGTFVGVGPLTPETVWFEWDGLLPGRTHYIRLNTLTPTGWLASPTAAFTTGVCAKPTASGGSVSQSCDEWGYSHAAFSWVPGGGDSQWLDLATDPEWVSDDMWMAYGPFSPQTAFHEMVILPGYTYWWRINTHSAAGWSPSPVWTFVAPATCAPGPAAPPPQNPPPISVPPRIDTSHLEWVYLYDDLEDYRLIIVRATGEVRLLEYGIGCISIWRYEGRNILIYSPGIFAGIGSKIMLPDEDQECRIWGSEYLP